MKNLFVLHHTYETSESETYKLLGIFSSIERAEMAINEYINLPGFKDYKNGFDISSYQIDEKHWIEGFGIDHVDDVVD